MISWNIYIKKDIAQAAKKADKERAQSDPAFVSATFDMQSVLQLPSGAESLLYCKRKLIIHNRTIYEATAPNKGYCYLWPKNAGKRGSVEIGPVLFEYIRGLPESVRHLSLFSDSCTSQNRNQIISATLLHAVQSLTVIEIIDQIFLVPGRTQMECDSMHSSIEHAQKHMKIYTVNDWENVMRGARRHNPYITQDVKYRDFYDLKQLARTTITNTRKTEKRKICQLVGHTLSEIPQEFPTSDLL